MNLTIKQHIMSKEFKTPNFTQSQLEKNFISRNNWTITSLESISIYILSFKICSPYIFNVHFFMMTTKSQ